MERSQFSLSQCCRRNSPSRGYPSNPKRLVPGCPPLSRQKAMLDCCSSLLLWVDRDRTGCSSFQGRHSSFQGRRSSFQGSRSSFQGRRSSFQGRRSSFQGSRSSFQGSRSSFQGASNPYTGSNPLIREFNQISLGFQQRSQFFRIFAQWLSRGLYLWWESKFH